MIIHDSTYMFQQIQYAQSIGDKSLVEGLKRLAYYETGVSEENPDGYAPDHSYFGSRVEICPDGCDEHSFYWVWIDSAGKRIMNGGLIFHGLPGEPDKSHSVTLDRAHGWQIHT